MILKDQISTLDNGQLKILKLILNEPLLPGKISTKKKSKTKLSQNG